MSRVLATAFCVALLAVAAAAFALTEGAKTELSPIYGTRIAKVFSPVCKPSICGRDGRVAAIRFELRRSYRLEAWVNSVASGKRVATLLSGRTYRRGPVSLSFSGRAADGSVLPDGLYVTVVRLVGDLTITFPNEIWLDTVAPRFLGRPRALSRRLDPGAVHEPQLVGVSYRLDEPAHAVLYVEGRRVALGYRQPLHGVIDWYGKLAGRLVPAGRYTLEIAARDAAGNQTPLIEAGTVTVGYLVLSPSRVRVREGARFTVSVIVGPAHLRYSFAGLRRSVSTHVLKLRAPPRRGRYRLTVRAGGHTAGALVVVQ